MSAAVERAGEADLVRLATLTEEIMAGRTDLAAAAGMTDDELEAVYALGHGFYASGQFSDALDFFRFLCIHRHTDARFWFGYGAASQMLGQTENAVHAYGLTALLDSEDPQVPLRAAECFVKLDQGPAARNALEAVLTLSEGKPAYAATASRARLMLGNLVGEGTST